MEEELHSRDLTSSIVKVRQVEGFLLQMRYVRHLLAVALAGSAGSAVAQNYAEVTIDPPKRVPFIQPLLSPFNAQKRYIGPAKLTNSPRLEQLVRGGNLYLNVDDVIALTLENNLDIAIQRYGAYLAKEVLCRTRRRASALDLDSRSHRAAHQHQHRGRYRQQRRTGRAAEPGSARRRI